MSENLSKSVQSLFSRTALGIEPGLEVITALLEKLGNPHRDLKVIHVAGTNGKGSVCAMIESVLRASGLKPGLYTSPHLFRFNERFRVNGQEISNADLEKIIADVEAAEHQRHASLKLGSAGGIALPKNPEVVGRASLSERRHRGQHRGQSDILISSGKYQNIGLTPHLTPHSDQKGRASLSERAESPPAEGCPTGGVGSRPATFFEISTAMAFEYFKRQKVDYAIIETGMGGRWDATNVVQPVISIITRIALDHADYLGTDLEKIAWEKAGIIKEGVPVICGPMPVEAEAVVYKEAAEKKVSLEQSERGSASAEQRPKGVAILGSEEAVYIEVLEARRTDQLIDIEASGNQYRNVRLPLGGSFQLENCGIAVAALEDLADLEGLRLQMKKGLEAVKWPGRFQTLSMKPPILFDGAHNPNAAATLFQTLEDVFPRFGKTYVFGFMKDKDVEGILAALKPDMEKAFAITLPSDRAMKAEEIAKIGKSVGLDIEPIQNFQPAREWVAEGKKRLLCFTGSLYLAAELRKCGFAI